MDTCLYAKIQHRSSIQSSESILAYPGVPDHTHMNGTNQIDVFMYT